jgi:predicted DNA-binding transcriptional regulator AlpA
MRYLSLSELRARLGGRSRSSIYCDITAGRLPRPIRLGRRAYWNEELVDARLRELAAEAEAGRARGSGGNVTI